MDIGVPRELKDGERRVGLVPAGVRALTADGHRVLVERGAGDGAGFGDAEYEAAGAILMVERADLWHAELIAKVKEVQPAEYGLLRPGTTILGFAQLTRDTALVDVVLRAGVRIIACETVRDPSGGLPLLAPMSRIAGRLAPLVGSLALTTERGGAGVLATGVDAVPAARVLVVGAGASGREAARIAVRLGCRVKLLSRGAKRLAATVAALADDGCAVEADIFERLGGDGFAAALADADLVIGAVLEPGRLSPRLITRSHWRSMRAGSAFVDIGIDQGGIAETSRMTTLSAPTYVEERIVHYAVPNMPALVARTATQAFADATLPYVRKLAGAGIARALSDDAGLKDGLQVWDGEIVHAGLAAAAGRTLGKPPGSWRPAVRA